MSALILDQKINPLGFDVSYFVASIVGSVSSDGNSITKRNRRAPARKRNQKRAKRFQRLVGESDDNECYSEDDGRMDIIIDRNNEAGETPPEDQDDEVGTLSDAGREGNGDVERRGSSEEDGDIVDDREGADGDESEEDGIDSGMRAKNWIRLGRGKKQFVLWRERWRRMALLASN